jgi:hypothetical protein
MAMNMRRAFNYRMLTDVTKYEQLVGSFDANNTWIDGALVVTIITGVLKSGNKFSQFEEAIALHNEDGGIRHSNYKHLTMSELFNLEVTDKVGYKGLYYNVLQKSDEDEFGFTGYILEKSENWTP